MHVSCCTFVLLLNSEKPRLRLGCPSRSTFFFRRLHESYFLWILAEKSMAIGPSGGGLTVLQDPNLTLLLVLLKLNKERKISPKRKFWGRTSSGHPRVIRADNPAQNFGQGAQILEIQAFQREHPWPKNADVHDPKGFPKFRSEEHWAEFSCLKNPA